MTLIRFDPDLIHVKKIRTYYDTGTSTIARETPNLLKYESQYFRCKVDLEIEESQANCHWSVGLVQACDKMYLENRYGDSGSSYWEFHPLKTEKHRMVNDSDGRQYPFYSLHHSRIDIKPGDHRPAEVRLQYVDHFYPTVAWELPFCGGVGLTDVIRKQDFWVWLVAIKRAANATESNSSHLTCNVGQDKIYVLKTMRWRYNLHMRFDPHMPLGRRLVSIQDKQRDRPGVISYNEQIPASAVSAPHCNAAQSLIWYPKHKTEQNTRILVPPKQIIVPWEDWVGDMVYDGKPAPQIGRHKKPKSISVLKTWKNDPFIQESI